jgi:hypothetical protein
MPPGFAGSQLASFQTHSLRCGLEECRQLRWLNSDFHAVRALAWIKGSKAGLERSDKN